MQVRARNLSADTEISLDFPLGIVYNTSVVNTRRCDGIGRRAGLKIRWWRHRTGSTPVTGTNTPFFRTGYFSLRNKLSAAGLRGDVFCP